jgi:hypothetical protein
MEKLRGNLVVEEIKGKRGPFCVGMLKTSTMPPYPLPLLDPSTIEALEQWIKMGAPKERKN